MAKVLTADAANTDLTACIAADVIDTCVGTGPTGDGTNSGACECRDASSPILLKKADNTDARCLGE